MWVIPRVFWSFVVLDLTMVAAMYMYMTDM